MGASVQFVGKAAVLKAFEKMEYSRWSLWSNSKDMTISHSGADMPDSSRELEEWLNMLRSNTTGIFTLRLYDKSVKEIKPSTPHVYAINFRMTSDEEQRMSGAPGGGSLDRFLDKMEQRFDTMEKRMKEIEKDDGEEPIKPWERMLENPVIMAGLGKMFGLDLKNIQDAKISGVPQGNLEDYIATLKRNDPDFETHMYKLATLSEGNKKQFNFLLSMLDQMKV